MEKSFKKTCCPAVNPLSLNQVYAMGPGLGMGWGRMKYDAENLSKPKITKNLLTRIASYLVPYWHFLLLAFVTILVTAALGLVPPLLIREILDKALPGRDLTLLAMLIAASLGATILIGLVGVVENFLGAWISSHIIQDIKSAMYRHLEYMSLSFFSRVKTGDIITRMTSDIGGIRDVFRNTIVSFIRNLLVLAATTAALFLMNWKLALVGIVIVPFFALPTKKVGKMRWKIASQTQSKIGEMNEIVQETLSISGATLMKIFNREKTEYGKFEGLNQNVTKLQIREAVAGRWFAMTINIFITIGPMVIYFFGGYLFILGELSIGAIVAFVVLLTQLYAPVVQLSNIHIELTRSLALFERIFEYFDMKKEIEDSPGAQPVASVKGSVEFSSVSFSYDKRIPVVRDVSFRARPGSITALVGPSGAGKSTITSLIPRLYDADSGSIRIDGRDIRDFTTESLRSHIGMVTQDTYLFNASIRENLLYAKSGAGDVELTAACRAAHIHEFITALPEGYETVVGNRGIKLSGGERQRLSIARVILKNPRIIILDEATSSLDSVSEHLIQEAMKPLLSGRTSFVIAHRLSTVMAADMILVVESGVIVETGKHEDLLARGGLYKVHFERQFRRDEQSD